MFSVVPSTWARTAPVLPLGLRLEPDCQGHQLPRPGTAIPRALCCPSLHLNICNSPTTDLLTWNGICCLTPTSAPGSLMISVTVEGEGHGDTPKGTMGTTQGEAFLLFHTLTRSSVLHTSQTPEIPFQQCVGLLSPPHYLQRCSGDLA